MGLLENVKVRRAGFAYRAEFPRFFDRFKYLSSQCWPALWTKSDKKGCEHLLETCSDAIPQLKKGAQCGKSKVVEMEGE